MKTVNTSQLKLADYNPKIRVTDKALKGLRESVKQHGIIVPLIVDKSFNIIDGHRRLAVAKQLKITQVPCISVNHGVTTNEYYETLNSTARKISAKEMIFIYLNGGKVPKTAEKTILKLESVLGKSDLKKLGDKYISYSILRTGKGISRYCGVKDDRFLKNSIMWLVNNKMIFTSRKAIEANINKSTLKNAVENDKPLKKTYSL